MKANRVMSALLLVIVLPFLNGCPCPHHPSPSPPIASLWYDAVTNELYVLKWDNILVFNNASTANGHISPARVISLPSIPDAFPFSPPYGSPNIWLDKASDQLFVASPFLKCIFVFTDVTTANGKVTPARVISGTTMNYPGGLWLDSHTNQLYVLSDTDDKVLVFTDATTAEGNITPARIISGTETKLNYPKSLWLDLWLDSNSDQLYVVSGDLNPTILVFTSASTANGNVAPARTIISTDFDLYPAPYWLWLDSLSNELYVIPASYSKSVLVFTNATTANGKVTPARKITTNQSLGGPLWFDSTSDQLYVVQELPESNRILVFDNASTINGDVTPSRVLYP